LHNIANQLHSILSDVVEPADKRADVSCAGFCRENRLRGGKTKRDVYFRAFTAKSAGRF
jgi:hypothetical protein